MEAGLAAAASTYDQHVFVDVILRDFIAPYHDAFRLRQEDVVLKLRGDKGLDVLLRPP